MGRRNCQSFFQIKIIPVEIFGENPTTELVFEMKTRNNHSRQRSTCFIPNTRPLAMSNDPSGVWLLDNRDSLAMISRLAMTVALIAIGFVLWNTYNGVQNDGKIIAFGAISGTVGVMLQMVMRVIPNASSTATRANAEVIKDSLIEAGVIPDGSEKADEEEPEQKDEVKEESKEESKEEEPQEEEPEEEEPEEEEPEEEVPKGPRVKI